MYAYMHLCMYKCPFVSLHQRTDGWVAGLIDACTVWMAGCIFACMCMYVISCIYVSLSCILHIHLYTHMFIHVPCNVSSDKYILYTCLNARMYVCMCLAMYLCI